MNASAAAFVAAAAVAAASQAAPTPRRPAPSAAASSQRAERVVPFKAGEALTYDVSWSDYLTAGTATTTVREKRPSYDSVAYYIVAEGRPAAMLAALYTLYYKVDTLLDAYTLLPQRGSVYSQEGTRRKMAATRFDQAGRRGAYEVSTATVVKRDLQLAAPTQDPLSAIYAIRALPLSTGLKVTMPLAEGGELYTMQVEVTGRERVTTPVGTFDAWRVVPVILTKEGAPTGDSLTLWISDDSRRLPLKLGAEVPAGRFTLLLREARG